MRYRAGVLQINRHLAARLEVVEGARLIDNIVQHDGGSASSLQPASGRLVRGTSESSRTAADDADGRVGKRRSGGLRISLAL
jgi:hypothetical protein